MQTSPGAPARDPNTPGYEMWSSGQKRQWLRPVGARPGRAGSRNGGFEGSEDDLLTRLFVRSVGGMKPSRAGPLC